MSALCQYCGRTLHVCPACVEKGIHDFFCFHAGCEDEHSRRHSDANDPESIGKTLEPLMRWLAGRRKRDVPRQLSLF